MATVSTQRFHCRCGENISLSDNITVARRVRNNDDGIVFTEQPVAGARYRIPGEDTRV